VVLGALLVGVLVLFLSCSGGSDPKPKGTGSSSAFPTPAPAASAGTGATADVEPTFEDAAPGGGGPALPNPSDVVGAPGAASTLDPSGNPVAPNVTVAAPGGQCTDAEVSVTPVSARTAAKRGTPVELRLKIKNISTRTCARDVGADLQEIYLKQGARKVWSSDICGIAKGSQVLSFPPNLEREYNVTWNGRAATRCAGGAAIGPFPVAGEYQLYGRLGGKVSAPVRLVVVA
jgi:hypothetical protein